MLCANLEHHRNKYGVTPLYTCVCWQGYYASPDTFSLVVAPSITALLNAGADPLAKTPFGASPFRHAIANEYFDICGFLVAHGASIDPSELDDLGLYGEHEGNFDTLTAIQDSQGTSSSSGSSTTESSSGYS